MVRETGSGARVAGQAKEKGDAGGVTGAARWCRMDVSHVSSW